MVAAHEGRRGSERPGDYPKGFPPLLLIPCPVCGAALQALAVTAHMAWHSQTGTLNGWTVPEAVQRLSHEVNRGDDAPTAKLPPITDTVRRRPPPPVVRELSERVELLRALVQELADYDGDQE